MRKLQGIHAANPGAVGVKVLIPAAHTMNNSDTPGWPAILEQYLPRRRPGSVRQPLKLQPGDDVLIPSISVLRDNRGIELIITGGQDDAPHLHLDNLVCLFEIDSFCLA